MCGVFGYVGKNDQAAELVLAGLRRLEYRGYDSWGVVVSPVGDTAALQVKKQPGKIGSAGVSELPAGTLALGHTRWATHGGVTKENAHPHLDCTGTIAVVHNGIIENFQVLKDALVAHGHVFKSETDTEVVAHMVEEAVKSGLSLSEAVRQVFQQLAGQNALAVLERSTAGGIQTLIAVRQGSPLVLGLGDGEQFIASDPAALLPHTREVYFLEDGELAEVTAAGITVRTAATGAPVQWQTTTLTTELASLELGSFQHYLQKEIHEQPQVLREIAASGLENTTKLATAIKAADSTWLVACGSAGFTASAGVEWLARIAQQPVTAVVGSEFGGTLGLVTDKTLVIGVSQSGETMDVLEPLKQAQKRGAQLAAVVNTVGSSLYRLVELAVPIGAGPELAVASTKAMTAKLAHFLLLAHTMAGTVEKGRALVSQAAEAMQAVLEPSAYAQIAALAKTLQETHDIFVIGKGLGVIAAHEAALKLKETAYLHAEGMSAGELKHGSLALIESGTPCIVFVPADGDQAHALSAAMELKARGGRVIGIAASPQPVFDEFIQVSDCGDATILPQIVVAQVLAYELALLKGIDPDKPRNLAKSVTVG
jgi:glucosamine--fructose-6-phosphate aminotransferase (isomerizing)